MKLQPSAGCALLGWILLGLPVHAANADVPGWVRDAAAWPLPSYPDKVAMVTLLEEENVTVDADGRRTMHERGAVKMLQRTRNSPRAYRTYNTKTGRIREFQGWLLPVSGKPDVFGKNSIFDVSLSDKFTFEETRAKVLSPGEDLAPGAVFAWEITEEDKSVFTRGDEWPFQEGPDPVLVSRYSLTVPSGWEVRGIVVNRDGVQPQVSGDTYSWELRNLGWIEPEEHAPGMSAMAPRLGVTFYPGANASPELKPLANWSAVSAWQAGLMDPSGEVTAAIHDKAAELTAGAKSELDRIRAIAGFVQKTNYVAVAINLSRGGGYTPHPAEQVMTRNYGDCKDKATLMRALLKAAGIASYPVAIFSGDRDHVRAEWPSPFQFNHVIIAVQVSADTSARTVLENPRLGRLLIFDPTDDAVPVGDLPDQEQGSHALIVAAAGGDLVTVPSPGTDANRIESRSEGTLSVDGRLSCHLQRRYFGHPGTVVRELARGEHDALKRDYEEMLSSRLGGLTLDRIEAVDQMNDDQVQLSMDATVKQFGHTLQNRLLLVSPGTIGSGARYAFPAKPRTRPVRLTAELHRDSVSIAAPAEFKVDEIPDPVHIESAYGAYAASWKTDGNKVLFEETLKIRGQTAPASEYSAIREFFEKVSAAQNSSVVLVKD